jgi:DMSO/TMAO reductase YedYZ molybdopterin-dependent catalytic subunit
MKKTKHNIITRRTLIEWIGKSFVIGLTGDLMSSCTHDPDFLINNNANIEELSDDPAIKLPIDQIPRDKLWTEFTVDRQSIISILNNWKLVVNGLVKNPVEITFEEMLNLPRKDQVSDLHCVTGWSVYDIPWSGFHISTLYDLVEPAAEASHITLHSFKDVYSESIPVEDALSPQTMMAYGINGSTIPLPHGFPLRLVVPYKFGYKSAKYIYGIEFTDSARTGYWEADGYSYEGDVPESRLRPK